MNTSFVGQDPSLNVPFYFTYKPTVFDGIPDHYAALAAPVIAYWSLSLVFHFLDQCQWKWLDKYRIHESAEAQSLNRASQTHVISMVIFQHVIQTILGYLCLSESHPPTQSGVALGLQSMENTFASVVYRIIGSDAGAAFMEERGVFWAHWIYWWGKPATQLLFAMLVIDTWQYFLHRWMHVNKSLYRHIHSVHHRLYVPYAFGALYNHPLEGFLLDTLGAVIAEYLTGLTVRQTILFFAFSTLKTVDDHCGYSLPFDPLQLVSGNNADYHDIHHQKIGIKSNFSQPFFIHWDAILGTRMTRKDIEDRRKKTA
ncbi:hypothetical protein CONPUDRAFT_83448 [Coniophora puteana RWD-64-598 SS2]|uniref:Fatty acid hydroxylase domain-containing protein n=1 Tax=Coniophora puteana (strain RWD-64-598) TaxID=741705 RepID=A0A5M3MK29_CONPW|nr:uncharacterized protein CONPUDRAFT_83448 [Coniophora puteana RWD-64-598 SS2]EIW79164.1 hypothetical protein CONPUDRAFT_83448 [Coniophora puteana RWD-64-598 SS2]